MAEGEVDERDLAVLREFGTGVPLFVAGPDGALRGTLPPEPRLRTPVVAA